MSVTFQEKCNSCGHEAEWIESETVIEELERLTERNIELEAKNIINRNAEDCAEIARLILENEKLVDHLFLARFTPEQQQAILSKANMESK